jgi:hypothetical protein
MTLAIHRGQLAAFCAGLIGSGLAFGASDFEAPFEEARTVYEGIFDAVVIERKICEEELARGVRLGTWNEAEQREGAAWLQASFDAISQIQVSKLDPQSQVPLDPRWTYLKQRLDEYRGVTALNNAACVEFSRRVQSLDHARSVAAMRMCEAAIFLAEDVWLNAKTPGDLAPAVRAIDYVRRGGRIQWNSYANQPFGRELPQPWQPGLGPSVSPEVVLTAIHFRSVICIPRPLLLPDPDQNPAGFWEASKDWKAMVAMKHRFVLRPRIAERFAELNARYQAKMSEVRQQLDRMILTNAPAAEFENAFRNFLEKPTPSQRPNPQPNPSQMPRDNPGYRDFIAAGVRLGMPEGSAYTAFEKWRNFRLAEESGDQQTLQSAVRQLQMASNGFTPEVAKFVSQRLSRIPTAERKAGGGDQDELGPSSGNPVNDLIAALAAKADREPLAEAWRRVREGDASPTPETAPFANPNWRLIAGVPGNAGLIDLREQATRQALASITKIPAKKDAEPIAMLLIESFEKALSTGAKSRARQLLQLDSASGSLRPDEHLAIRQVVELLPDPADPAVQQDKSAIDKQLRALLSQVTSPAAARFAADQLKKSRR